MGNKNLSLSEKKANFVKNYLEPLLQVSLENVEACSYWEGHGKGEYVTVMTKTGHAYHICVTADSPIAIAADVINFMKFK